MPSVSLLWERGTDCIPKSHKNQQPQNSNTIMSVLLLFFTLKSLRHMLPEKCYLQMVRQWFWDRLTKGSCCQSHKIKEMDWKQAKKVKSIVVLGAECRGMQVTLCNCCHTMSSFPLQRQHFLSRKKECGRDLMLLINNSINNDYPWVADRVCVCVWEFVSDCLQISGVNKFLISLM